MLCQQWENKSNALSLKTPAREHAAEMTKSEDTENLNPKKILTLPLNKRKTSTPGMLQWQNLWHT